MFVLTNVSLHVHVQSVIVHVFVLTNVSLHVHVQA